MPFGMVMGKHLDVAVVDLAVIDATMVSMANRYYASIGVAIGGGQLTKNEVDFIYHPTGRLVNSEFIASKEDLINLQVTFVFAGEIPGEDAHHFRYLFVAMSHCLKEDEWTVDDVILSGELSKNSRAQMRDLWFKQAIECL